jgi:hypothetical protein
MANITGLTTANRLAGEGPKRVHTIGDTARMGTEGAPHATMESAATQILTRPVAVSVRVDVNEAVRISRVEANRRKGHTRAGAECRNRCSAAMPFSALPPGANASLKQYDRISYRPGEGVKPYRLAGGDAS